MIGNETIRRWTGATTAGTWMPAAAGPFGYGVDRVGTAIGPTGRICASASAPTVPGDAFVGCTDATGAWVELA